MTILVDIVVVFICNINQSIIVFTLIIPNNNPVRVVGFYPMYLKSLSKLKLVVEDVLMQPQQHGSEVKLFKCSHVLYQQNRLEV